MQFVVVFLSAFIKVLNYAILIRVLMSWLGPGQSMGVFGRIIRDATDPFLNFFKKFIPPIGMLDISPIVAILALNFFGGLLVNFLSNL